MGKKQELNEIYESKKNHYKKKIPSINDIKSYKLDLLSDSDAKKTYKVNGWVIVETFGTLDEFYPLTNNEILSILNYYKRYNVDIDILHYKLKNIQGFVDSGGKRKKLTVKIPSALSKDMKKTTIRGNALIILLHECSHLLDNMIGDKCESEADRFANQEYKKWKKIIDITDEEK
jgi:hypothetical protein